MLAAPRQMLGAVHTMLHTPLLIGDAMRQQCAATRLRLSSRIGFIWLGTLLALSLAASAATAEPVFLKCKFMTYRGNPTTGPDGNEFYLDINERRINSTWYTSGLSGVAGQDGFIINVSSLEIYFGKPNLDDIRIDRRSGQITRTISVRAIPQLNLAASTAILSGNCQSSAPPATKF